MLLRALAGAAFPAAAAVVATLAVGGATAAPQACANSTAPTILPEPEFTLGATNVIRWEHVDQSCWDNSGGDGKKSAERKFDIVVTNVANGLTEWTSVSGEDETDATISGSEFPFTNSTGIEGRRFTYKIRRTELVCNAGNPQTGVCIDRRYRFGSWSATVASTQDGTPPSATLQLGFGSPFTRFLSVPAVVTGSGGSAWMQFATDPALPCGRPGVRSVSCVAPFSNGTQIELAPGPDGERQMFGRVWDDARRAGRRSGPDRLRHPAGERVADLPGHDHRRPDRARIHAPCVDDPDRRRRNRRLRDGGAGGRSGRAGQRGQHGPRPLGIRRRSDGGDESHGVARVRRDGDVRGDGKARRPAREPDQLAAAPDHRHRGTGPADSRRRTGESGRFRRRPQSTARRRR